MKVLLVAVTHNRVLLGLSLLAFIIAVGTLAYMLVEGWTAGDAFFMTLTTVTTVGYREIHPLDAGGRLITSFLIFFGVGTAFYILTAMVATVIEGDLREVFGHRRMRLMIEHLTDHYVVCGYGRVGEEIARELSQRRVPFVVLDTETDAVERARAAGDLALLGDATSEENLLRARILQSRAVIAATGSDIANTYITLSARALQSSVFVVARVSSPDLQSKLRQAGADRVISPYAIGGRRMALAALQPMMTDFLDIVSSGSAGDGRILAEFSVDEASRLEGRTLAEVLAGCKDVVVLAIVDATQRVRVAPAPSSRLSVGDRLTVIGEEDEIRRIGAVDRS